MTASAAVRVFFGRPVRLLAWPTRQATAGTTCGEVSAFAERETGVAHGRHPGADAAPCEAAPNNRPAFRRGTGRIRLRNWLAAPWAPDRTAVRPRPGSIQMTRAGVQGLHPALRHQRSTLRRSLAGPFARVSANRAEAPRMINVGVLPFVSFVLPINRPWTGDFPVETTESASCSVRLE